MPRLLALLLFSVWDSHLRPSRSRKRVNGANGDIGQGKGSYHQRAIVGENSCPTTLGKGSVART